MQSSSQAVVHSTELRLKQGPKSPILCLVTEALSNVNCLSGSEHPFKKSLSLPAARACKLTDGHAVHVLLNQQP